ADVPVFFLTFQPPSQQAAHFPRTRLPPAPTYRVTSRRTEDHHYVDHGRALHLHLHVDPSAPADCRQNSNSRLGAGFPRVNAAHLFARTVEAAMTTSTSPPRGRLEGLEAIRGIAALVVVLHHLAHTFWPGLLRTHFPWRSVFDGSFAVTLFFV